MKNVKELQAIITSILVLNSAAEKPNKEIEKLCEYAFRHCFEAPTELLRIATNGFTYNEMLNQVNTLLQKETKFKKVMGTEL